MIRRLLFSPPARTRVAEPNTHDGERNTTRTATVLEMIEGGAAAAARRARYFVNSVLTI